jgi:hypothetical protein
MSDHAVTIGAERCLRSGAIAGAIAAFAFMAIHGWLTSDIRFSALARSRYAAQREDHDPDRTDQDP